MQHTDPFVLLEALGFPKKETQQVVLLEMSHRVSAQMDPDVFALMGAMRDFLKDRRSEEDLMQIARRQREPVTAWALRWLTRPAFNLDHLRHYPPRADGHVPGVLFELDKDSMVRALGRLRHGAEVRMPPSGALTYTKKTLHPSWEKLSGLAWSADTETVVAAVRMARALGI